MPPEVIEAFCSAAREAVPLEELQAAASRCISRLTSTDAGLVTCGAAAGLTLGTAAILARDDLKRMEQLPDCSGFPSEFIIAREQRSGYDHAVRAAGASLVEVGFNEIVSNAGVRRTELWEYESAISSETAGIVFVQAADARPPLHDVVQLAHKHDLPVLVDAAGELPPRSNLTALTATGADLVVFSGGKAIRGPQSTGILCGRRDLISSAALQMLDMDDHDSLWQPPAELINRASVPGLPRHGLGRALKVSKEEIVALLTALQLFAAGAWDEQNAVCEEILDVVENSLRDVNVTCRRIPPASADRWPVLEIHLTAGTGSAMDVARALRSGRPPVYTGHARLHENVLVINPVSVNKDQADALAERLVDELRKAS